MRVDVALCQYMPAPGKPEKNAERVMSCLRDGRADVYVFPEMFLTGYGAGTEGLEDTVERCLGEISDLCGSTDRAVALGTPRFASGATYNSLAFLSPDGDSYYDKSHLAGFGIYAETGFEPGSRGALGRYHDMLFGMCICYDIFFPEILHGCSLAGASVNICSAASALPSKPFFDRVLPARALENVTYMAFVNNVGPANGLDMHGCSRGLDPFGDPLAQCGTGEDSKVFAVDTDDLAECREVRRHLSDYRSDVDWGVQGGRRCLRPDNLDHTKVLMG